MLLPSLTILFMTIASCRSAKLTDGIDVVTRIVNGRKVNSSSVPWQVAIRHRNHLRSFCGGSIIGKHWVLTAAHCFFNKKNRLLDPSTLELVVGATDLLSGNGFTAPAVEMIIHQDFCPYNNEYHNDIALLYTNVNLVQPNRTAAIPIATGNDTRLGTRALISGFGDLKFNGPGTTKLHAANVTIVRDKFCERVYSKVSFDNKLMICAGDPDSRYKGVDTCNGDSGGPLVVTRRDGQKVLAGITSFGDGCASGVPAAYTRASRFVGWIVDNIMQTEPIALKLSINY